MWTMVVGGEVQSQTWTILLAFQERTSRPPKCSNHATFSSITYRRAVFLVPIDTVDATRFRFKFSMTSASPSVLGTAFSSLHRWLPRHQYPSRLLRTDLWIYQEWTGNFGGREVRICVVFGPVVFAVTNNNVSTLLAWLQTPASQVQWLIFQVSLMLDRGPLKSQDDL